LRDETASPTPSTNQRGENEGLHPCPAFCSLRAADVSTHLKTTWSLRSASNIVIGAVRVLWLGRWNVRWETKH